MLAELPRYSNSLLLPYWAVLTTPLFFTRNAIIIAIHFGAVTVVNKKHRFLA